MPTWQIILTVASSVLGIIGTGLGIFGIKAYVDTRMKHKAEVKNREEDKVREAREKELQEIEDLRHQKQLNDLRTLIREENALSIAPLKQELTQVSSDVTEMRSRMNIIADGTTDILRERLLSTYYKCMEKGYRTQYDYENVEHMHKEYVNLGGNTFVADCVAKIKALPSEEEYKAKYKGRRGRKPNTTKKVLLG